MCGKEVPKESYIITRLRPLCGHCVTTLRTQKKNTEDGKDNRFFVMSLAGIQISCLVFDVEKRGRSRQSLVILPDESILQNKIALLQNFVVEK